MILFLQNIFRFILLVTVQVLVLNNVQFLGYINPYIYILFIISLPVQLNRHVTLLLGFLLGIIIDIFTNTPGLHAFATILISYLRFGTIRLFTSIEEGSNPTPSFYTFGVSAYIKYVLTLVIIHHSTLFILEAFSLIDIKLIFLKILLNSFVTILIILGIQSFRKK